VTALCVNSFSVAWTFGPNEKTSIAEVSINGTQSHCKRRFIFDERTIKTVGTNISVIRDAIKAPDFLRGLGNGIDLYLKYFTQTVVLL
jgi:hypothetical protein